MANGDKPLTKLELETNVITLGHIDTVRQLLRFCEDNLRDRGLKHDQSKLQRPEVETFAIFTPKLAGVTYGSEENEEDREKMSEALTHHYAKNGHHPEHFKNGVNDMTLLDFIEMFADWKASTLRHNDGNILHSIEHNAERFKINKQMVKILENTAKLFEDVV